MAGESLGEAVRVDRRPVGQVEDQRVVRATASARSRALLELLAAVPAQRDHSAGVHVDPPHLRLTLAALERGDTDRAVRLRHAWTDLYGNQSVIGLAPSAAAAQVLGDDLGVSADTLAKWLHDHHAGHVRLSAGQLVIIDEASLAGTRSLHHITEHAATAGAKVLLVGDWAQVASVDAGGALRLLARDRDDIAQLIDVRRFFKPWEAAATLQLRDGNPAVLDTYAQHGRLHDGDSGTMRNAAYTAWQQDQVDGKQSLLIAPTREQVALLNRRAQADRITTGYVHPDGMVALRDATIAGDGDIIVTRRNDRRLHGPGGWVRNGDRWTVRATHPDGTLTVQPAGLERAGTLQLPADYVAAHVELGYATTAHRAQGATSTPPTRS